jgi:hypothetical protein
VVTIVDFCKSQRQVLKCTDEISVGNRYDNLDIVR